jgi:pyroglutamyl-peptidase
MEHKSLTVLITGFAPFGGDKLNPSWSAAKALHKRRIAEHDIIAAQLPTEFVASIKRLRELVICLGLAAGRSALSLERVAINVDDARIADNAGAQPIDEPIVEDAPAAYFSTLPIKAMQAAIHGDGIAAEVSQTAGTFVCNHVFYGLMHALAKAQKKGRLKKTRGGFMHVPLLPEMGKPSMTHQQVVKGLRIAIHAALTTKRDIKQGAGMIS